MSNEAIVNMIKADQKNIIQLLISLANCPNKILEFPNGIITKGNPIGLIPGDFKTFSIQIKKSKELKITELMALGLSRFEDLEKEDLSWPFKIEKTILHFVGEKI